MLGRRARTTTVDPDRLVDALHRVSHEDLVELSSALLGRLPAPRQIAALRPYLDVAKLKPTRKQASLADDVRAFDRAVRAGDYYEGFNVNSKNFMEKSEGTERFIRDCRRLLERGITDASKGSAAELSAAELRACFEVLFVLLRRIDEGDDDVFFADEQGSFQVGVPWERVLPAWFACLAPTTEPEDFARLVVEWVDAFQEYCRGKHFGAARRVANAAQKRALRAHLAGHPSREDA